MRHVSATALVIPKHFIFTFMGNLQLFILIQNKEILQCQKSHFWTHPRINSLENISSL